MKGRRDFTDEFRKEAVQRATEPGAVKTHVAEELDIGTGMLSRWIREDKEGKTRKRMLSPLAVSIGVSSGKQDAELARLRQQVAKLTRERDALKKTLAVYLTEEGE